MLFGVPIWEWIVILSVWLIQIPAMIVTARNNRKAIQAQQEAIEAQQKTIGILVKRVERVAEKATYQNMKAGAALLTLARLLQLHQQGINVDAFGTISDMFPGYTITNEELIMDDETFQEGMERILREERED